MNVFDVKVIDTVHTTYRVKARTLEEARARVEREIYTPGNGIEELDRGGVMRHHFVDEFPADEPLSSAPSEPQGLKLVASSDARTA